MIPRFGQNLRHSLRKKSNKRWTTAAALLVAIMVGLGLWAHDGVSESLHELASDSLTALLESNREALDMWIEAEKQEVHSWARAPVVEYSVEDLVALGATNATSETLLASPVLQSLREYLAPVIEEPDCFGYIVTDREGRVIAAAEDKLVGRRLTPEGQGRNAAALQSRPISYRPFDGSLLVEDMETTESVPVILSAATVLGETDEPIAVLTVFLDPEQDFSRLLSVGRLGDTGSSYAFDSNGVMLSELRQDKGLREAGLLPDTTEARSTLAVLVRDPGGNLLKGHVPDRPIEEKPLTQAVASAVTNKTGVSLRPYRDYRGVEVIGTWTWFPDHEFGIVTEIELADLNEILRPLKLAFWGMGAFIVLLTAFAFFNVYRVMTMRRAGNENRVIGQYTLLRKLGEGGMGTVHLARHEFLRRKTAVKLLSGDNLTPEMISRFEREVQVTCQLTHPNTIEIYDYGRTEAGEFYYVMEYIPGVTLARLLEDGAFEPARAVHLLKQISGSLAEAHDAGLIHRDIKPLNVMVCSRGGEWDVVKVLDFGLVKDVVNNTSLELTVKGIIRGTPMYIAPERLRDPSVASPASDIYSLGVLAFNMLTGRDPFQGANAMEVAEHSLRTEPPRVSSVIDHAIPKELDDLVFACMQKDPAARPRTARDFLQTLYDMDGLAWSREQARAAWMDVESELQAAE